MKKLLLSLAVLSAPAMAHITVRNAKVEQPMNHSTRAASASTTAVVALAINNPSHSDTLLSASSDVARSVELHRTQRGQMVDVPSIAIPHGAKWNLNGQGYHLMLVGLRRPLTPGETIPVRLKFASGHNQTVQVRVPR